MRKETSFFTLTDLFTVACITSFGAYIGWRTGKMVIDLELKLCDISLKLASDKLKKLTTKAEKKEEE